MTGPHPLKDGPQVGLVARGTVEEQTLAARHVARIAVRVGAPSTDVATVLAALALATAAGDRPGGL